MSSLVQISLASEVNVVGRRRGRARPENDGGDDSQEEEAAESLNVVSPGDAIARQGGFMRGHGTYIGGDGQAVGGDQGQTLYASVAGVVRRVNKLVSVQPVRCKYQGEVGDVVVGRVTEVQQRRWKVDTNMRLDSVLLLSSVNLPGGELRRRSAEDELGMRGYLQEGDLISAEVQQIFADGAASLHTRSLKYGKLSQGVLVQVPPGLIRRRKSHFHRLPCGVGVILGNNGYVWIYPAAAAVASTGENDADDGGFTPELDRVDPRDREAMARLRNCLLALAANGVMLWDTTLIHAYDVSAKYGSPAELLAPTAMADVAEATRKRLEMEMDT